MQAKFLEEGGGARRKEYEIKVKRGNINSSLLFGIGAEHLGEVIQKDTYLAAEDGRTWRIREENGKYVFTQKGHDISKNSHVRVKEVLEKLIDKAEACRLAKAHKIRTVICKTSTLFRLLSAEQALVSQKSVIRIIGRNIGLATLVVVLSGIIGAVVSGFVG